MRRLIPLAFLATALVTALYVAYGFYGHVGQVAQGQAQLQNQFDASVGEFIGNNGASALVKPPETLPGDALARLTIPRLDLSWIVVEGVALDDIVNAPGHYPTSQLPGQVGNFAVAGHREPGLFWDLDKVRAGDKILVQTRKGQYTYTVTRNFITDPQSWPEVSKTPPGFPARSKVLTLTTCDPKYDNFHRLVIHGVLVEN